MYPENSEIDSDNVFYGELNDDGTLEKIFKMDINNTLDIDTGHELKIKTNWIIVGVLVLISLWTLRK